MSFDTIVIANRGEIACRVIRSARALGYRTVALYSDADATALHTDVADEAIHIGAAPAADSYLDAEKVLAAAQRYAAPAIHPGYGFLSENAAFARACEAAGVVFIGPSADAIDAMADKARAKAKMLEAGVPCVPGFLPQPGQEASEAQLIAAAPQVGYPLLVKAVAGGGGRGMRAVHNAQELPAAIASARREAQLGFGNGALMLERLVTGARHIEIQVFADAHGNAIHLGERDCSLQRRHQKVMEESPSPAVDADLRKRMGEAAVAAALAINYRGAGTVEFLLADSGEFFFLEMNTRLQVEHPVTELVTGLDLVEMQLAVAAGERLALTQEDIELDGHAIEVRLYAEDAYASFVPQTGPIIAWEPAQLPGVRIDHGLREGQDISAHYDPMIAKVIAWGPDRNVAIRRLKQALRQTCVLGPGHNKHFLDAMLCHPTVVSGEVTTSFLDKLAEDGLASPALHSDLPALAALLWLESSRDEQPEAIGSGWTNASSRQSHLSLDQGDQTYHLRVSQEGDDYLISQAVHGVKDAGPGSTSTVPRRVRVVEATGARVRVELDGRRLDLFAALSDSEGEATLYLEHANLASQWRAHDALSSTSEAGAGDGRIKSPVSGKVLELHVAAGDLVDAGQLLLKLESMKIESSLLAPVKGVVSELRTAANEQVQQGQLLLVIEATPGDETQA